MNKNQIVELCLKEIALIRAKAENQAYLNNMQARKNPEYLELDKQERNLVFTIGKNRALNIVNEKVEAELKEVRAKKNEILNKIGLSLSDLSPKFTCPQCEDTGYTKTSMCSCLKNRIHKQILKQSGGEKESLFSFSSFDENVAASEEHKTALVKIKSKFQSIATSFPKDSPKFIVLCGKTGVGKTFLTECLASEIINKGHIVSFVSSFSMNNLFSTYHTTYDNTKSTLLSTLLDPELLIIDDLGTEPMFKNITKEYLYLILSERSRNNKLTVLSTNLTPKELMERYNERIFSRLFNKRESLSFQINGEDIRLKAKKNS